MQEFKVGDEVITHKFEDFGLDYSFTERLMGRYNGLPGIISKKETETDFVVHGRLWPASALQHVTKLEENPIITTGTLKINTMENPTSLRSKEEIIIKYNKNINILNDKFSSNDFKLMAKAQIGLYEQLFGKEMFQQSITDKVKTFEDALNICQTRYNINLHPIQPEQTKVGAFERLLLIADTLNEGWKPNYKNENEKKYIITFLFSESGIHQDFIHFVTVEMDSPIVFKTEELAKHAIKCFEPLFRTLLT